MSSGRVLAFDPGTVRIGVAVSDPLRIVATPLDVIAADAFDDELSGLIDRYDPTDIVVGLPIGLAGKEGEAATAAREFGARVAAATGLPVHFVDERFTTATAEAALLEGGVRRRDRRQKVDRVAAAVILRQFLDRSERSARDPDPPS